MQPPASCVGGTVLPVPQVTESGKRDPIGMEDAEYIKPRVGVRDLPSLHVAKTYRRSSSVLTTYVPLGNLVTSGGCMSELLASETPVAVACRSTIEILFQIIFLLQPLLLSSILCYPLRPSFLLI
jgi:hypothetical protein